MIKIFKRSINIIITLVLIAGAVIVWIYFGTRQKSKYEFMVVQKHNLMQEINVNGQVKPVKSVNLAIEKSGKVAEIFADVGQRVKAGDILVTLENGDLLAQLHQAEANVNAQQAKLDELKNKTTTNLSADYNSAIVTAQKSVSIAKNSLLIITGFQYEYFFKNDQENIVISDAKAIAVQVLLGGYQSGWWDTQAINQLNGGAFGTVQNAIDNPTNDNIDKAITETLNGLQKTKQALDTIIVFDLTTAEKASLNTEKNNISTEIITLSGKQQIIDADKTTGGVTIEQIKGQEAQLDQAKASVENLQVQIAKTILRTPINGIVVKQDAKIGEIVAMNSPIVSVISDSQFQIEVGIAESDIAKIKIGDSVNITLDAYGNDVIFAAKVVAIDPAETVINGVSSYKITIYFLDRDERIKSGMSVNMDIVGVEKDQVLAVPQRSLIQKNGNTVVFIDKGQKNPEELVVTTGLKSNDGYVEITSGLKEGDKIVNFGI